MRKKVCARRGRGGWAGGSGWLRWAGVAGKAGDLRKLTPVTLIPDPRAPRAYPRLSNFQWPWKNGYVTPLSPLPSQPINIYKEKNKREWVVGC
jgi:hypothetical protein